jgi:hypothetical protein
MGSTSTLIMTKTTLVSTVLDMIAIVHTISPVKSRFNLFECFGRVVVVIFLRQSLCDSLTHISNSGKLVCHYS